MSTKDFRYNPRLRVDVGEARKLRPLIGWQERTSQVLRGGQVGRYVYANARTIEKWAQLSGRDMLAFVDSNWYWRVFGYPEHVAKVFAYRMGFSCARGYNFVRRVRRFFASLSEYGINIRKFCAALSDTMPDRHEQAKKDSRALLEAMFVVWGPEKVRDLLLRSGMHGAEDDSESEAI